MDWGEIGQSLLHLPISKCFEITRQFSSDDDRVRAGVREWLLRDPLASWRRMIRQLYDCGEAERADSILHYAEELTGIYMIIILATLHRMIHAKCTK
jgi:hypothetical protein